MSAITTATRVPPRSTQQSTTQTSDQTEAMKRKLIDKFGPTFSGEVDVDIPLKVSGPVKINGISVEVEKGTRIRGKVTIQNGQIVPANHQRHTGTFAEFIPPLKKGHGLVEGKGVHIDGKGNVKADMVLNLFLKVGLSPTVAKGSLDLTTNLRQLTSGKPSPQNQALADQVKSYIDFNRTTVSGQLGKAFGEHRADGTFDVKFKPPLVLNPLSQSVQVGPTTKAGSTPPLNPNDQIKQSALSLLKNLDHASVDINAPLRGGRLGNFLAGVTIPKTNMSIKGEVEQGKVNGTITTGEKIRAHAVNPLSVIPPFCFAGPLVTASASRVEAKKGKVSSDLRINGLPISAKVKIPSTMKEWVDGIEKNSSSSSSPKTSANPVDELDKLVDLKNTTVDVKNVKFKSNEVPLGFGHFKIQKNSNLHIQYNSKGIRVRGDLDLSSMDVDKLDKLGIRNASGRATIDLHIVTNAQGKTETRVKLTNISGKVQALKFKGAETFAHVTNAQVSKGQMEFKVDEQGNFKLLSARFPSIDGALQQGQYADKDLQVVGRGVVVDHGALTFDGKNWSGSASRVYSSRKNAIDVRKDGVGISIHAPTVRSLKLDQKF